MNILLYKPLHYDPDIIAYDINFYADKDITKDAINSFFLEKTPTRFRWLETLKREYSIRGRIRDDYSSIYWYLSNPREEVFKKLAVVSVY